MSDQGRMKLKLLKKLEKELRERRERLNKAAEKVYLSEGKLDPSSFSEELREFKTASNSFEQAVDLSRYDEDGELLDEDRNDKDDD